MGKRNLQKKVPPPSFWKPMALAIQIGCMVLLISRGFAAEPAGTSATASRLNSLNWVGYYDPTAGFLSAKALLRFNTPTPVPRFWLADGLQLSSVRSGAAPVAQPSREFNQYLLRGLKTDQLEISYNGRIVSSSDPGSLVHEPFRVQAELSLDRYSFLACVRDFYPHTGMDFSRITLSITVPDGWNCLGSGILSSAQTQAGLTTYNFDNAGAKGMSLVFGQFQQIGLIAAEIPVRVYGCPQFNYNWYFPKRDIQRLLAFYHERFGPLDVPELQLLIQRGRQFGGVSYCGLVVLNVDSNWTSFSLETRRRIISNSAMSIFDAKTDLLSHEISHQWWGGLMSWKTPEERWITEGLATYSSLISLRAWKGDKEYRQALARLRRRVGKFQEKGTMADGYKLLLSKGNPDSYQALVYGKPALMLAALAAKIGEEELCARLRSILRVRRKCSITAQEFLSLLSAGDETLRRSLQDWVFGRGLPVGL